MSPRRRYPPPWKIEEGAESYIVTDASGQRLAFIYFENEPQRQTIMKRISRDDAWAARTRHHAYSGAAGARLIADRRGAGGLIAPGQDAVHSAHHRSGNRDFLFRARD